MAPSLLLALVVIKPFIFIHTKLILYRRVRTRTRLETEAQGNSKIAYLFLLFTVLDSNKPFTSYLVNTKLRMSSRLDGKLRWSDNMYHVNNLVPRVLSREEERGSWERGCHVNTLLNCYFVFSSKIYAKEEVRRPRETLCVGLGKLRPNEGESK